MNTIIRKLFDKNFNYAHKILALEPREVYAFVFRNLIRSASNDVVVIVPSRALINEYYDRIREIVNVKEVLSLIHI